MVIQSLYIRLQSFKKESIQNKFSFNDLLCVSIGEKKIHSYHFGKWLSSLIPHYSIGLLEKTYVAHSQGFTYKSPEPLMHQVLTPLDLACSIFWPWVLPNPSLATPDPKMPFCSIIWALWLIIDLFISPTFLSLPKSTLCYTCCRVWPLGPHLMYIV